MKISMLRKEEICDLTKSEKKDLSITKRKYDNGLKCVEFFNRNGVHRAFSKKTDKAIKKALKLMRENSAKNAA